MFYIVKERVLLTVLAMHLFALKTLDMSDFFTKFLITAVAFQDFCTIKIYTANESWV